MRYRRLTITLAALVATNAGAADEPVTRQLLACRGIVAAEARLACFDRQAASIAAAVASDRITVVDTAKLRHERQARFGLPPGADDAGGRLSHVEGRVASAAMAADGRTLLVLADGSRWRQVDDYPLMRRPLPGDPVVIDVAAFGSYKLRVGKEAPIRVRRTDRP